MNNANKNLGIKKYRDIIICHTDIEEEEAIIDIIDTVGDDHIQVMVMVMVGDTHYGVIDHIIPQYFGKNKLETVKKYRMFII
jgi:phosphoglycolate phosphatase-like HAD superfamily hydrolase